MSRLRPLRARLVLDVNVPVGLDTAAPTLLGQARDEHLMELARCGDERAFEVIIERYRPGLLAHCRAIVGEASAQDAVQQAFINAWCALRGGSEVRHLRAWLFAIGHRAALQGLREQGAPTRELPDVLPDGRAAEEQIERRAYARATLAAVAALPPRERDALVWTSIQGRSGRDTARALGVSEQAVRQLIFRARARTRAALGALLPPAFGLRLPFGLGHGARRVIGLRALAEAGPVQADDALAWLAPVLAVGALVAVPLAASQSSSRPHRLAQRQGLQTRGEYPSRRRAHPGTGAGRRASAAAQTSLRASAAAQARLKAARPSASAGVAAPPGVGARTIGAAGAAGVTPVPGREQAAPRGSLGATTGATSAVGALPGPALQPVAAAVPHGAAGTLEKLGSLGTAPASVGSVATGAATQPARQAIEQPQAVAGSTANAIEAPVPPRASLPGLPDPPPGN